MNRRHERIVSSIDEMKQRPGHEAPRGSVAITMMAAVLGLLMDRQALCEGQPRLVDRPADYGTGLFFSADHHVVAVGEDDGSLRLADFKSGATIGLLRTGHKGWASGVAFSPDGHWIATGGWMDRTLRIWDVKTRRQLSQVEVSRCSDLVFSPDGRTLVTGHSDEKLIGLMVWDVTRDGTLKLKKEVDLRIGSNHPRPIKLLRYSPDGRWVAFGHDDIYVVDILGGTFRIFGSTRKPKVTITAYLFFNDKGWLVSADRSGILKIWNLIDGTEVFHLENPNTRITSMARIPRTDTILTGTEWNTVTAFDLRDRTVARESLHPRLPARLNHFKLLNLSNDGLGLAVRADQEVYLFDVDELSPRAKIDPLKP